MSLLLLKPPTGYPAATLVAYFDLMVDNLLLTTAMTLNWNLEFGGTGVVPTRTTGQTDKDGGTTAVRLQMNKGASDTSADYSVFNQVVALPNPHASAGRVWLRSNDASTYNVILRDNAASVASGVLCAVTPTWQSFAYTPQAAVAAASSTFYLGLRGALGCSQTADILVCFPQFVPRVTMPDYVATTDLQSLASLYGKSPTLQRGATSGAEASDGSYNQNGWGGVTDDYQLGSALPDGTMAAPFDIPLVGKFNGTAGTIVSLAATGATTHYQRVAYNGSGQIRIGSKAGAGAETFSADLAVSTTAIVALRLRSDGTTLTLTNHATGTSVTLASQSPTGACRLGIGCTAGSTVADIASAITATLGTLHGSQLSTAGWTRAYRDLKARAARKGVTVTP